MRKEILRKLFHSLSLVYLLAYVRLGPSLCVKLLGGWALAVIFVETARLRLPALNAAMLRSLGNIHRDSEAGKPSGILWTALGCWLAVLLHGGHPARVQAAFLYLAFGDSAAALIGRRFGRLPIGWGGRRKTLEGSLACFAACLLCGWAVGLSGAAVLAGALAASLVELLPVPLDDNLWLPCVSAAALGLFGV